MQQETPVVVDSDAVYERIGPKPQKAPQEIRRSANDPVMYRGFDALVHKGQIVMHADVGDDVQSFFNLALHSTSSPQRFIGDPGTRGTMMHPAPLNSGFNTELSRVRTSSKHAYGRLTSIRCRTYM